jgi:hypothetical protein
MVQISPGVVVKEFDLTGIVPAAASTDGAIAGVFRWGPVGERVLVDSENVLVSRFGKPTNFNAETFFTAADFLSYSNRLYVVRAANTTSGDANAAVNAMGNTGTVNVYAEVVRNESHFTTKNGTFDSDLQYLARYPGEIGNTLRVSVCDTANQFNSTIVLNNNVNANGVLTVAVGNTIGRFTIVTTNSAVGNIGHDFALSVIAAVGDYDRIEVGNTAIGTQYLKVLSVAAVPTIANLTHITVDVTFEDRYRLSTDWSSSNVSRYWEFYNLVDGAPGQSPYQLSVGNTGANDEMHVVVVDHAGGFTGSSGTVLEVYRGVSRATDAKTVDGGTNYYRDVISQGSQYVYATNDRALAVSNTAALLTSSTATKPLSLRFVAGQDGLNEANVALATLASAYDFFASTEEIDISLVMQGRPRGGTNVTTGAKNFQLANYLLESIAALRVGISPVVVFISPDRDTVVNNPGDEALDLVAWQQNIISSSYGFLDSGYKYRYDRYNDIYRWTPMNGDMAGLAARTDNTNDAWWSPAGFNRGQVKNVIRLAFNPRQAERDVLYKNRINPVVAFPNNGVVLYGDKTLLTKPSAFDRINVRRLFNVLEKSIAEAARFSLFEFNDEFTRAQFRSLVIPYLRDVKGRRGITDFLVVCDETNNTGEVIDRNEFRGDIYIKPARSINFIELRFVAVRTAVNFNEVVGQIG